MVSEARGAEEGRRRQSGIVEEAESVLDVVQDVIELGVEKMANAVSRADGREKVRGESASSSCPVIPASTNNPDHIVITLKKRSDGFGFNIVGGVDQPHLPSDSGVFVSMVRSGGAADLDGRLKTGYKILSVNGVELAGLTHDEVVATFKKQKGDDAVLFVDTKAEERSISPPPPPPAFPQSLFSRFSSLDQQQMTASAGLQYPTVSVTTPKDDDAESVMSYAPSTHSLVDDVPRTPKKPFSIIDPRNPSVMTEVLFVSIGLAAVVAGAFVVYKYVIKRK